MPLTLTLLGTGTPSPLLERAGSSAMVAWGEELLIFDCGPFSVRRLIEKGMRPAQVTGLFLTHLHYDHCVDYAHLVLSRWDQGAGQIPELQVHGPRHTKRMTELLFGEDGVFGPDLAARTGHPGSHFIYEMRGGALPRKRPQPDVRELADGSGVEGKDWKVTAAEVAHCQPQLISLAYRLEAEGQSIVFSGDAAPTPALTDLTKGADVLVNMCHFINGVVTDPRLTTCCSGHLDAARTAQEAGVRTLVLTHITEQVGRPGIRERLIREAGEIFDGNIVFGEDLLEVPMDGVEAERIR